MTVGEKIQAYATSYLADTEHTGFSTFCTIRKTIK